MLPAARRSFLAVLVSVALPAALTSATPAFALPCDPTKQACPDPEPIITKRTVTRTLTVTPPSVGSVSGTQVACPGDCEATDSQEVTCTDGACDDPDPDAWDTITLSASRGAGWQPAWSGCPAGGVDSSHQCVVKLDADRTVGVSWTDVGNPTAAIVSPSDRAVTGPQLSVSAAAWDNAGVSKVDFYVNGVLRSTDTWAPYQATIDLSSSPHGSEPVLTARATDLAGRTGTSADRTVRLDKHVALTVGSVPAFTNAATVPVSIATDVDAGMACRVVGGAAAVACDGPAWSGVDASSPDGAYTYEVKATDAVANAATITRSFVLDRTAPTIAGFDGPAEGSIVGTDRVAFTFAVSDANLLHVQCKLGSSAPGPCTSAAGHELTGLTDGTMTFSVIAADKAGNETVRTRTFQVQRPQTTAATTTGGADASPVQTAAPLGTAAAPSPKPIAARLVYRKQRRAGRTRLVGLRLTGVPQGATIRTTCKGGAAKGCPRQPPKAIRAAGTVKLGALARLRLRKDAVVRISVTAPGYAPRTMTVRI